MLNVQNTLPAPPAADPHGQAYIPDGRYLKPGYLSQEPRQPAYSFGPRNGDVPNGNPGPNSYDTRDARNVPTSSWGPAPRQYRPATALSLRRPEEITRKAKGPSFGLPYTSKQDVTPGPLDYQCGCGGSCCRYCDSYAGVTINGRLPTMYGVQTTHSPGPQAYHTDCSTIGVAGKTQRSESARPIGTGYSASMGWTAQASSHQPQQRRR
jgi:hypothetical protein